MIHDTPNLAQELKEYSLVNDRTFYQIGLLHIVNDSGVFFFE